CAGAQVRGELRIVRLPEDGEAVTEVARYERERIERVLDALLRIERPPREQVPTARRALGQRPQGRTEVRRRGYLELAEPAAGGGGEPDGVRPARHEAEVRGAQLVGEVAAVEGERLGGFARAHIRGCRRRCRGRLVHAAHRPREHGEVVVAGDRDRAPGGARDPREV